MCWRRRTADTGRATRLGTVRDTGPTTRARSPEALALARPHVTAGSRSAVRIGPTRPLTPSRVRIARLSHGTGARLTAVWKGDVTAPLPTPASRAHPAAGSAVASICLHRDTALRTGEQAPRARGDGQPRLHWLRPLAHRLGAARLLRERSGRAFNVRHLTAHKPQKEHVECPVPPGSPARHHVPLLSRGKVRAAKLGMGLPAGKLLSPGAEESQGRNGGRRPLKMLGRRRAPIHNE
jgi:hypothetical protein